MKKLGNIAVFDDDKCFLYLLKGYCYTNNIMVTELPFNLKGLSKISKLKPNVIIAPLELLIGKNNIFEAKFLRRATVNDRIKICAVNKNAIKITDNMPEWIGAIINNSFDMDEIDNCFKTIFSGKELSFQERRHNERRHNERRLPMIESKIELEGNSGFENNDSNNLIYPQKIIEQQNGTFRIDQRNKHVVLNGQKIDLTRKEFELIELLSTDANRVFEPKEIIAHVWPETNRATKADLYQYMHLLRKKIEIDPNHPRWIITVKGFGYKLNTGNYQKVHQRKFSL